MPHELHASLDGTLPEDAQEAVESIALIAAAWAEMMEKVKPHKLIPRFTVNDPLIQKPLAVDGAVGRRRRGRPRVTAETPRAQLPVAEEV